MRCVALVIIVSVGLGLASSQRKPLSTNAQKVADAFAALRRNPRDPSTQEAYIQAFPHDYKTFADLFDLGKELYDGHDFIVLLPSLAQRHEEEIGSLLIGLAKDAHYDADAENYLQNATAVFGSQHTESFVRYISQLPAAKQKQMIAFLAAGVEDFNVYPEYQAIIENLRKLGHDALARDFEDERRAQSHRRHH